MTGWLVVTVLLLTAVAAAWTVLMIVRDESPPGDRFFVVLGVLLLALVVQLVGGVVALATTDRDVEAVTFVSYLVTVVLAPPFGAALALVERFPVSFKFLQCGNRASLRRHMGSFL